MRDAMEWQIKEQAREIERIKTKEAALNKKEDDMEHAWKYA